MLRRTALRVGALVEDVLSDTIEFWHRLLFKLLLAYRWLLDLGVLRGNTISLKLAFLGLLILVD